MDSQDFSRLEAPESTGGGAIRLFKLAGGTLEIIAWLAVVFYPAYLAGLWLFQFAALGSWPIFLGVLTAVLGVLLLFMVSSLQTRFVLIFGVLPIASALLAPIISRWF